MSEETIRLLPERKTFLSTLQKCWNSALQKCCENDPVGEQNVDNKKKQSDAFHKKQNVASVCVFTWVVCSRCIFSVEKEVARDIRKAKHK